MGLSGRVINLAMQHANSIGFDIGLLFTGPRPKEMYGKLGWKVITDRKIKRMDEQGKEGYLSDDAVVMFYPLMMKTLPLGDADLQGREW